MDANEWDEIDTYDLAVGPTGPTRWDGPEESAA